MKDDVARVMSFYPLIYFACHTRHITDPGTGEKLTANQASILDHLDIEVPVTLYDLARHMGVTPSTMSISIERIGKLGYIKKEKDKTDRRKVNLTLSPEGEQMKQNKSVLDPALVEVLLSHLNESERKAAIDGLDLLTYAAEISMKNKSQGKSWNDRNRNPLKK